MSRMLNLYDAKAQLSSLVEEAAAGAEIIIARRRPGSAKGKIWMADDFDSPLPESLIEAFAGKHR